MAPSGNSSVHSPGSSFLNVAGETVTGPTVIYEEWMHFRLHVDTDSDVAEYYYTAPNGEETLVHTWQWSLDTSGEYYGRKMAAMDFFPPQNAANSMYYLDNFSYKKIGGESAPHLNITPEEIAAQLEPNSMDMVPVVIENTGNSIGDWAGWLDFGQGPDGNQTAELMWHNGAIENGIGSSAEYLREMAIRLTPSMYAGAAMGMKIVSATYFTSNTYASADGHYTFRVYGQGLNDQPGEMLTEKTINSSVLGDWISVTFDEPVYLTGQDVWVTVELLQAADEYPMSMDGGFYGEYQDGNWLSTGGTSFSHCYSAGSFEGAWLITANCRGTLVPGGWASIDKNAGAILGGHSETINMTFNSIGLANGEYHANLIINTNDVDLPHVEIPVSLIVDTESVAETENAKASIYPNPSSGMVTLEGTDLNTLAIYNVAGPLVRIVKLNEGVNNIDMNVEAGVYFFSIYDNNGDRFVQRVVITK